MYKLFFTTFLGFLLSAVNVSAQEGIDGVINAEKNFATYAVQHNTRDAFLYFLDSANAVVFSNGKIINAFAKWNELKADSDKLLWQPAFAGISQSGELGFTTGPWEYKQTLNGNTLAAGTYTTIWHLNNKGDWKFLVDIGTTVSSSANRIDSIKKWIGKTNEITAPEAVDIDKVFIQQYEKLHNDAFKAVITGDSWFNLPGQQPAKGVRDITVALQQIPAGLEFIPMGGGISSSSDLAYIYGTVRNNDKMENYLRVWQKTKDGYKLLLQVLKW